MEPREKGVSRIDLSVNNFNFIALGFINCLISNLHSKKMKVYLCQWFFKNDSCKK